MNKRDTELKRLQDENRRLRQRLAELPYPMYVPPTLVPLACGGMLATNPVTGLTARVR